MKQEYTILANGVKLYVVTRGDGAPVVLLGGPWFGQRYLQPLAENLAADFQIIAYDPRGSGLSDILTADEINLAGHLADLDGLRQALNLERLNLVGHSVGALVCLAYAIEHPQNTGALVLADPGPPLDPEMQEILHTAFMAALSSEDQEKLAQIRALPTFESRDATTHEDYFKALYVAFFSDHDLASQLAFGFTPATAQYALEAEEQLVEQLSEMDLAAGLGGVTSPALVIHAEQDLIPEDFSRFLAGHIPGAQLALLEGVGHFAYMENPTLFRRTVSDFLRPKAVLP